MTPEAYVRDYVRQVTRGARALNFVDSTGRIYRKVCRTKKKNGAKCSSKIRHWSGKQKAYVCGRCGAAWKYVDKFMARGEVQVSRDVDLADRVRAEGATIGLLLHRFLADEPYRWESRLFVYAALSELGWEKLHRTGRPDAFREFPKSWTEWNLRGVLSRGRAEFRCRLERAGLAVD